MARRFICSSSSDQSVAVVHRRCLSLLTWRQLQRFYQLLRKRYVGTRNRNLMAQCLLAHCCIPPRRIVVSARRLRDRILAVAFTPHRLPIADSSHRGRQCNWLRQDCRTTLITLCLSPRRFSMRKRLRSLSNRTMWACLGWPIRPIRAGRAIAESELAKKGEWGTAKGQAVAREEANNRTHVAFRSPPASYALIQSTPTKRGKRKFKAP